MSEINNKTKEHTAINMRATLRKPLASLPRLWLGISGGKSAGEF